MATPKAPARAPAARPSEMPEAERASFASADVVIILPTLNEEDGLARTLRELPLETMTAAGWTVRRLVIDGGSTDKTVAVAREWSIPVLHQSERGKGAAIREALDFVAAQGARFAVVLDADCTYPGAMVPAMVQLLDAGSQLVVGVREPTTSAKNDPREFLHRVGNRVLNLTASQLAGLPILDLCSGFWAVDVRAVSTLDLETNGFEIEAELFTKAYRAGYTVTQIPIAYRERVGMAKLHAIRDGAKILLTTVRFGRRELSVTFRPPKPTRLRDFLSIAMVHDTDEFRLIADPSRSAEAELLAQRIRASRPGSRVQVWTGPARAPSESNRANAPAERPTLTITLPATSSTAVESPAVVHLPRSGRVVTILESPSNAPPSPEFARSGGYRLEFAPSRSPTLDRMRALVVNTFPSERAKELAFLGVNGQFGNVAVWTPQGRTGVRVGNYLPDEPAGEIEATPDGASAVLADDGL